MSDTVTAEELDAILKAEFNRNEAANHRRFTRIAYNGPVVLSQFSSETGAPVGPSIVTEGCDISEGGMRISHENAIPDVVLTAVFRDFEGKIRKLHLRPIRTTRVEDNRLETACRFIQPQPTLIPR